MIRRTRRPIAVAMLVAVAALASGCGLLGGATGSKGASSARASTAASPLAAQMTDFYFPATGEQTALGFQFGNTVHALVAEADARCLASHGFHVPVPSASAAASALSAVGFQNNTQFPDLPWIARHHEFAPLVGLVGHKVTPPRSGAQRAEAAVSARCHARDMAPMTALLKPIRRLAGQWISIITDVEASAPVLAAQRGFASCMERHGVPAADAGSLNAFLAWETGLQTHVSTQAATAAIERHWAPLFVSCARHLVSVQEGLQESRRRTFLQDHYAEITAAQAQVVKAFSALEREAGASLPG
jgi:hypothetical protein